MTTSDPGRVPRPRQQPADSGRSLRIDVRSEDDCEIVELHGEVDIATAPRLRSAIAELLTAGRMQIIIDLDGVTFLDAAALDVLIRATASAADAGGALQLTPHPRCMRMLAFTGETHLVNVTSSLRT